MHINNLGTNESLKAFNSDLLKFLQDHKQNLSDESQRRLESGHVLRILDSKHPADVEFLNQKEIDDNLPKLDQFIDTDTNRCFQDLLTLIRGMHPGINVVRNHHMVRGLDYYNGTCFEFKISNTQHVDSLKTINSDLFGASQNTLLAGGRYDYLAS